MVRLERSCFAGILLFVFLCPGGKSFGQGELHCGDYREEYLGRAAQHFYWFQAEAGDVISLNFSWPSGHESGFEGRVDLYSPPAPGLEPMLRDLASGNHRIEIPESGTYTLRVRENSFYYKGTYQLSLYWICPLEKQCVTGPILCGELIERPLGRMEQQFFHFAGSQGDLVSIKMSYSSSEYRYPVLDLYGPDPCSNPLLDGAIGTLELELPEDGTYTLRVRELTYYYGSNYVLSLYRLDPICDCNQNGIRDDEDISSGASRDENQNGIPDECQPVGTVRLEAMEPTGDGLLCAKVVLDAGVAFKGGELGLTFDASRLSPVSVEALLEGAVVYRNFDPGDNCGGVEGGMTLGWYNSETEDILLPAGSYEVLKICFSPLVEPEERLCLPLRFVNCLGEPEDPVGNILTNEVNQSASLFTTDGEICFQKPGKFRRGDVNEDDGFDVSDAIYILGCQFLGGECTDCEDASDVNDDGQVDVSDAIHLLTWRFLNGVPPAGPFPDCGYDSTDDDLNDCRRASCQ